MTESIKGYLSCFSPYLLNLNVFSVDAFSVDAVFVSSVAFLGDDLLHERFHLCDVVFFGHTHRFTDVREDGIRLINPGSCSHNRDGSPPSFGLLTFEDDGKIDLKRYNIKI